MNEALKIILEFGFKEVALASIDAYTHKDNISFIILLKKNNFEQNSELKDNENSNNIIVTRTNQQLTKNNC